MPKVVYDHQIFDMQPYGGISRYFCEIASQIKNCAGWSGRVVAPLYFNSYLAESTAPTLGIYVPTHRFRLGRLCGFVNKSAAPPLMSMLAPDLIHQTYYPIKPYATKSRVVVTVYDMMHELLPHYFPADDRTSERKRRSVEAADHVLCISHNTAKDLVRLFDVPVDKITVTQLGYSKIFLHDGRTPAPTANAAANPYLLFVGGRGNYKNFSRVLAAYAASKALSSNFDLVAFGGSPFTSGEVAEIRKLGLRPESVRRASGNDEVLARYYANARVFVYPSEYEGFGIPILEAMSSGCPVACSVGSSVAEVAGNAAEYFEPTDIESIRIALERVALDESRCTELKAAGALRCREFSWERCASETVAAYNTLL